MFRSLTTKAYCLTSSTYLSLNACKESRQAQSSRMSNVESVRFGNLLWSHKGLVPISQTVNITCLHDQLHQTICLPNATIVEFLCWRSPISKEDSFSAIQGELCFAHSGLVHNLVFVCHLSKKFLIWTSPYFWSVLNRTLCRKRCDLDLVPGGRSGRKQWHWVGSRK